MTSRDETAVDDELQTFIADCEFKTRKILRANNSRARENAKVRANALLGLLFASLTMCCSVSRRQGPAAAPEGWP